MKKTLYITLATVILLLSSCSDGEIESTPNPEVELKGSGFSEGGEQLGVTAEKGSTDAGSNKSGFDINQ